MRIGIVGAGRIGGVLGRLWARAGHEVMFASRHPESLDPLMAELGPSASRGTPAAASAFGEAVLVAVPYGLLEALGRDLAAPLAGKVVIEAGNPYPSRDGDVADRVIDSGEGTGAWSARWLPGARLVRGFNSVWDQTLAKEAHRAPPRVGIPLASDDAGALEVAAGLVEDAGFDPVVAGPLARARDFDVGTPVYNTGMSGPDLRRALGVEG